MFSIIAAIGKNRELGKNNQLVFHIKEDMRFFKDTTIGHKVVMGQNTWDSLPQKLPNRENIVISRQNPDDPDLVIHDLAQFIAEYQNSPEEIFIIGGGTIYAHFLPYADNLYLTEIDATVDGATVFFPEFDKSQYNHKIIKKGKENDLAFTISKYTSKKLVQH